MGAETAPPPDAAGQTPPAAAPGYPPPAGNTPPAGAYSYAAPPGAYSGPPPAAPQPGGYMAYSGPPPADAPPGPPPGWCQHKPRVLVRRSQTQGHSCCGHVGRAPPATIPSAPAPAAAASALLHSAAARSLPLLLHQSTVTPLHVKTAPTNREQSRGIGQDG